MLTASVLFCLVVGVSDGDTLTARCGEPGAFEEVKVRIAGIDAPEKAQPFGEMSRQTLARRCFRMAAVIRPQTRDRYGRTVAEVDCQGQSAGSTQVASGMAWVYDKYAQGHEHLYPLQDSARSRGHGLWSQPGAVPPWDWRRRQRDAAN